MNIPKIQIHLIKVNKIKSWREKQYKCIFSYKNIVLYIHKYVAYCIIIAETIFWPRNKDHGFYSAILKWLFLK